MTLHKSLKSATKSWHDAAEASLNLRLETFGAAAYRRYLTVMRAVHHEFAAQHAQGCESLGLVPRNRAIIAALDQDLAVLAGCRVTVPSRAQLSSDVPHAQGVAYAFEGAAMGAAILRKRIAQSTIALPEHYLSLLTEDAAERWWFMRDRLAACAPKDSAVDGAIAVFKSVIGHANHYRTQHG